MMVSSKPSGGWGWPSSDVRSQAVSGPRLPAAQHHHMPIRGMPCRAAGVGPVTGPSSVPAGQTFSRTSRQNPRLARAWCACGRLALGEASRPTRSMPFKGESWGAGTIDKTSGASHGKAMRLGTSDGQTMTLRCAGECVGGRRGRLSDANASTTHDSTAACTRALVQGALVSPCATVHCRSTAALHHHRGKEDMRARTTSLNNVQDQARLHCYFLCPPRPFAQSSACLFNHGDKRQPECAPLCPRFRRHNG